MSAFSDLQEQARLAKDALLSQRYSEAIEGYKKLIAALPNEPGLRFNLAIALHSAGRYREAVQQLEAIRASQSKNSKYWFLLGIGYLKLDEPRKAIEPLRRSLELDPPALDTRLELGSALLESGQFSSGESHFRQLSVQHPDLPKVWEGLALCQLFLSREAFEKLDKTAPISSFRYGLAAIAAAESGKIERAVQLYEKALDSQPSAPWMRSELRALKHEAGSNPAQNCRDSSFACRFDKGQWAQVIAESSHIETAEALYWRSRAYAQLARQAIGNLASLPPSPEQYEMLARAYTAAGQSNEAIAELRQAASLRPGDALIQSEFAKALCAGRRFDEALPILRNLLMANENQPENQFELGDALFSLGQPDEALGHLQRAVLLDPQLLPAQAKLGEALVQAGNFSEAVSHLLAARSIDQDGSINFQLANAYRHLGNTALAADALARRKKLQSTHTATPE